MNRSRSLTPPPRTRTDSSLESAGRLATFAGIGALAILASALVAPAPAAADPSTASSAGASANGAAHSLAERAIERLRHHPRYRDTPEDIEDPLVMGAHRSSSNGATHVYLRQRFRGLEIVNANLNLNFDRAGNLSSLRGEFARNLAAQPESRAPVLSPEAAIRLAGEALGFASAPARTLAEPVGPERRGQYFAAELSVEPIPARLVYYRLPSGELRLSWELVTRAPDLRHWGELWVDAGSGELLEKSNWIAHASYEVYAPPLASPHDGPRSVAVDPADSLASPLGWHDTDGLPGPESTLTRGNNVDARVGNRSPDGGAALDFHFAADPETQAPADYWEAAVTNLFYWTNLVHDVLYRFGFDEASGNFQHNNYGGSGLGGDALKANAQASGLCFAFFGTPPDGTSPGMWIDTCGPPPNPTEEVGAFDGDFDNGVIAHEYCHGLSTRLTGGSSDSSCLGNAEQAGEGWSDFCSLFFTAAAEDTSTTPLTIANYLSAQPAAGPGLRSYPYSSDLSVNPLTYADLVRASAPHEVGEIWASLLFEMYWQLVDAYGFDADLAQGEGGNHLAMQLVVDGLKLQPCRPGFVDARDAILEADRLDHGGTHQCLLWTAFAKRGLGLNAEQGDANSLIDGQADFSLPPDCVVVPDVAIDIRPSPGLAFISPSSNGWLEVAILGSTEVDLDQVDPESLAFGPSRAELLPPDRDHGDRSLQILDVDRDGFDDLVARFRIRQTGIGDGDREACLVGQIDGAAFEACDEIETVAREKPPPAAE